MIKHKVFLMMLKSSNKPKALSVMVMWFTKLPKQLGN